MSQNREKQLVDHAWSKSIESLREELSLDTEKGLSPDETRKRLKKYGKNVLREKKKKSALAILLNQFKNLIIALLVIAGILSFAFGEMAEGYAIIAVIIINTAIGFYTEIKAVRSMEALRKLSRVDTTVRRGGETKTIPAQELVPGDVVILEGGDIVTADLRLVEANKLQANESALTGESVPVSKNIDNIEKETPLADRTNMLFKGTAVTRGSGAGIVIKTGMATELGHISALVEKAEEEATPLEKRLDRLGHKLIWLTLLLAGVIAVLGILRGKDLFLMIETAVALAVAAIPEGLPIVATIALARGMLRMAKRNALINKLTSVETLGATNVICTDKTGTLTENRMTVTGFYLNDGWIEIGDLEESTESEGEKYAIAREALKIGALCNNASLSKNDDHEPERGSGDPMEVALLAAARKTGIERDELLKKLPEEREEAFDSETKMMATYHKNEEGELLTAVKGAPEAVIRASSSIEGAGGCESLDDEAKKKWIERNEEMAEEGLRVLALARKKAQSTNENPYEKLTFLGLVGLADPPREDVREALENCRRAGIRVVMITGDHPVTARSIARSTGLTDDGDTCFEGQRSRRY